MHQLKLFLGVALFMLGGCSSQPPSATPSSEPAEQATAGENAQSVPNEAVSLRSITPDELVQELQMRLGDVVLLDMWATW